jgi:hypothetical protein
VGGLILVEVFTQILKLFTLLFTFTGIPRIIYLKINLISRKLVHLDTFNDDGCYSAKCSTFVERIVSELLPFF